MVNVAEQYLNREALTLQEIINFCRGAEPEAWPPPQPWKARFQDLKRGLELANAPLGGKLGSSLSKGSFIQLPILSRKFVSSRVNDPDWDWLVTFCRRWAKARGIELSSIVGTKQSQSTGEAKPKYNGAVQDAINLVVEQPDVKATILGVINWLKDNTTPSNPFETGIPDCHELYVTEDGLLLAWVEHDGRGDDLSLRSIERYVERALSTL